MKQIMKWLVQQFLRVLARWMIFIHRPLTIAITGSTNKTIVKEALIEAFRSHGHSVMANPRSYNTEFGVPLSILGLEINNGSFKDWVSILLQGLARAILPTAYPRILILELGVDRPGDMNYLLSIIRPTVGIITDVTSQYIAHFGQLDRIVEEYGSLLQVLQPGGLAVLNADDQRLRKLSNRQLGQTYSIGECEYATHRIRSSVDDSGMQHWVVIQRGAHEQTPMQSHRHGSHHRFAETAAYIVHQWVDRQERKQGL